MAFPGTWEQELLRETLYGGAGTGTRTRTRTREWGRPAGVFTFLPPEHSCSPDQKKSLKACAPPGPGRPVYPVLPSPGRASSMPIPLHTSSQLETNPGYLGGAIRHAVAGASQQSFPK